MKKKILLAIGLLLLFAITTIVHYQPELTVSSAEVPDSITHHSIKLHGKNYAYTTRAGTIKVYDHDHKTFATMFYTANTLDNVAPSKRPITFFYNGGPGASSTLLRMASFGPKRVILNGHHPVPPAPYQLIDNQYSLLNKTDLVFIDAPGTGFGRVEKERTSFYGVDEDVHAFSSFITQYLTTYDRLNSPKFLFGESYGTTRTAILVNQLQHHRVQINGIILQSSILNYGLMSHFPAGGDWSAILYLPSLAATTWHFHASKYHPSSLSALLKEVEHFASTEYLLALAKGSTLSKQESQHIAKKLHRYLGLPTQDILSQNLRISSNKFRQILLKKKILGRFDTRFVVDDTYKGKKKLTPNPDPTGITLRSVMLATNAPYLNTVLKYHSPFSYQFNSITYDHWNYSHHEQKVVNAAFDLTEAMAENPYLQVFSSNGYYDLATPFFSTVYTLEHLNLTPSLQNNITVHFYNAGHMIYTDIDALKIYKKDLDHWYDATLLKQQNDRHTNVKKPIHI